MYSDSAAGFTSTHIYYIHIHCVIGSANFVTSKLSILQ